MNAAADPALCLFGELPDELLVAVASELRIERGFLADEEAELQRRDRNARTMRSLYSLALSCRKLNAIVTPLLYQCIIQTKRLPWMPALFTTVFRKPALAQHIRYIEFSDFASRGPTLNSNCFTAPDYQKYSEHIDTAQWLLPAPRTTQQLRYQCGEPQDGARISSLVYLQLRSVMSRLWVIGPFYVAVLLLSIADNAEDVALPGIAEVLSMLAYKKFNRPGVLKRLWLRGSGMESSQYQVRFISSRSMKPHGHLVDYLRRLLSSESACLEYGPPPIITDLSLIIEDAAPESLDTYIRSCVALERFSCRWQWIDEYLPGYVVDLPALHRSLQRVQRTLSHLTIDTSESAWRVGIDQAMPALGSLREFDVLMYLDVSGLVLWGDDDTSEPPPLSVLLPDSLQILVIKTEWDDDVEDALHQLSIDCEVSLPRLKEARCTWTPAPGFVADYLIDTFQLVGVKLVLDIEAV